MVAYGYPVVHDVEMDPYVSRIETAIQDVVEASVPGRYLVDVMPFRESSRALE